MLKVNNLIGFGGSQQPLLLYDVILKLGLSSNLVLCLDAADLASYSGTGQTWTDRAAGNNFTLGPSTGVTSQDPTFNGTAGNPTESTYFSFDGGDFFQEAGSPTFADDWHKNNATFSFVFGMYVINSASFQTLFTSDAFGGVIDTMEINLTSTEAPGVAFNDGTSYNATHSCTASSWNIFGGSYSEASTNIDWNVNGQASSDTTTAKTSTATPADQYMLMGNVNAGSFIVPSGTRLAFVAMWNAAIGPTALQNLYTALKARRMPSAP